MDALVSAVTPGLVISPSVFVEKVKKLGLNVEDADGIAYSCPIRDIEEEKRRERREED